MEMISVGAKTLSWKIVLKMGGLLALVFAMAASAYAAPSITSSVTSEPPASLTAKEARAVSTAAGKLLRHVEKARRDISMKKTEKVVEHIKKGLRLIQIIENAVPPYEVHTKLESGELSYDEVDYVGQRFVPIYSEYHHTALFDSVLAAKKILNQNTKHNRRTKEIYAPVVEDVVDVYTSVDLDVFLARDMLEDAKGALLADDLEMADVALEILQTGGVFFNFVVVDLPLEKAAQNIQMAAFELKRHQPEKARVEIERAVEGLKQYESLARKERVNQVEAIHGKIDALSKTLETDPSKDDMEIASSQLDTYWNQIQAWLNKV